MMNNFKLIKTLSRPDAFPNQPASGQSTDGDGVVFVADVSVPVNIQSLVKESRPFINETHCKLFGIDGFQGFEFREMKPSRVGSHHKHLFLDRPAI